MAKNTWISAALGALTGGLVQTEDPVQSLEETAENGSPNVTASDFANALQQYQLTGNAQVLADYLSGQGENWSQLVNANPWQQQQYHQTKFQKFLSKLGFRTGYDTFLESQQMGSNQYLADLMQQYYQQEYNKPSSQVDQMRAAGQNPDLLGTQGVQSAPSAISENDSVPSEVFRSQEISDLSSFANMISGTVNLVSGAIGSVFQMSNLSEDLRAKHIANGNGLVDMAKKLITDFGPTDLGIELDGELASSDMTWQTLPADAFTGANVRNIARNIAAKKLGLRNKDISRVIQLMKEMYPSLGGQIAINEGQKTLGTAKHDNLLMQGDSFWNPRGWSIETQYKFIQPYAQMQEEMTKAYFKIQEKYQALEKQAQTLQGLQQGNQIDYEAAFDGTAAAEATNVSNELAKLKSEFFKDMQEAQNEYLAKVKRSADAGDRWSKILYFGLIATGFITSTGVGQVLNSAVSGVSKVAGAFKSPAPNNFVTNQGPRYTNIYN